MFPPGDKHNLEEDNLHKMRYIFVFSLGYDDYYNFIFGFLGFFFVEILLLLSLHLGTIRVCIHL